MSCGSHCRYMINDFPYALYILAFEVFPAFRGFSKYKAHKLLHMLCSGPSKQPVYRVIIDNFFHAEHRFSKYNVNVVVATEQERQNYPVALQFTDDPGSCSSSVTLPSRMFDHIVDTPSSNEGLPSSNPLEVGTTADVSRKRQRCEDGIEDDSGYPHWELITPDNDSSTIDKQLSSGIDTNCTAEELR
ncbi:hypothetical protein K7X08_025234 [Anisodus acutangulus]|uniref:Uncharacterized protein n=1 Tax=Anisodus acutangulus TaxID=402998 RepID=A0A9Q1RDN7_9SOLA|nr:hypothetical protein K7X08_025234 [Anisodus acutangulus]